MRVLLRGLLVLISCCLVMLSSPHRLQADTGGAVGADLSPVEYSILKNFSAEFCEAIEDGVSVSSAYEIAMPAALWKSAGNIFGYVLSNMGQEVDPEQSSMGEELFIDMVLRKTQKCLTPSQSEELQTVLNAQWQTGETS
jgi:hypothetical protein